MLTERKKRFCHEYLIDYNVMRAMMRTGYAKSTASQNGYALLRDTEVQAYLATLAKASAEKINLTPEMVLDGLRQLAFANLPSFYKWSEEKKKYVIKSLDELTPDQKAAVSEYKPGEYVKLYSREGALDKLAKHFKLYTDIDATVNNLYLLPPVTYNGFEIKFNVGKPAPKVSTKSD